MGGGGGGEGGWYALTHSVLQPAPVRLSQSHRPPPAVGCTCWHADWHACLEHGRHSPDCKEHDFQEPAAKEVKMSTLASYPH